MAGVTSDDAASTGHTLANEVPQAGCGGQDGYRYSPRAGAFDSLLGWGWVVQSLLNLLVVTDTSRVCPISAMPLALEGTRTGASVSYRS